MKKIKSVVCSLSGGIDSTTLLYFLVEKYGKKNVHALSFDYGQRHFIEIEMACRSALNAGVSHEILPFDFMKKITGNTCSMMGGGPPVPTYEDIEKGEKLSTYVPFRNLIIASVLMSYAESTGSDAIALGIQYGDYENSKYRYWDCSELFLKNLQSIADLNDKHRIELMAPFVSMKKEDIVKIAFELNVPVENTWSCYDPKKKKDVYFPCGVCPTCKNRKNAFLKNKKKDPVNDGVRI